MHSKGSSSFFPGYCRLFVPRLPKICHEWRIDAGSTEGNGESAKGHEIHHTLRLMIHTKEQQRQRESERVMMLDGFFAYRTPGVYNL